jgi:hypothetical protein
MGGDEKPKNMMGADETARTRNLEGHLSELNLMGQSLEIARSAANKNADRERI